MLKVGILATHPIQYHAPLFRFLAQGSRVEPVVYFAHRPTPVEQGAGFGVPFTWDVDLTQGYPHIWLKDRQIGRIILKEKFDAFLVFGWNHKSYRQAIRACWRSRTPVLVRGDSQLAADRSVVKRAIKKVLYPNFMKRFSACLAVGKRSQEYFKYYGAKRVILSPHFVDNEWFAGRALEAERSRQDLKQEFGIASGKFVFLFVGKFEEKKRPMDLLRALKGSDDLVNKSRLLMVGDGVLRRSCQEYAKANGLPVTFAGFINQSRMPSMYAISDALVLPSDGRETWGLVVNEAMACGVPAIVSERAGCQPDLVIEERTGLSYKCGDVDELSRKMIRLASKLDHRALGQRAKEHIAEYSVVQAACGIYDGLNEVTHP